MLSGRPEQDAPPSFGWDRGRVDGDARPGHDSDARSLNVAVIGLPRVSNYDDLDPFRRAGCRIRVVNSPHELSDARIVFIPGSKSTIADLRWMKSRGLDSRCRSSEPRYDSGGHLRWLPDTGAATR
jgi:cobyric acid synthase